MAADQPSDNTAPGKRPRLLRLACVCVLLLLVLAVATPWIIAHTGLRDRLINAIMGTPDLSATSQRGSFGWISPLSIEDMEINGKHRRFRVELKSITAERSWPRLLASSVDLGTIVIEEPRIQLLLPFGESGTPPRLLSPKFTADVNNAALIVRVPELDEPVIDIDNIDLTFHVEGSKEDRVLTLDPLDVFTRRKLTPRVCRGLLQLMNPSLRDAAKLEGEFSLSLAKLRIPIGISEDEFVELIEFKGELALHQVSMETQSAMLQVLTKVLADVYGKPIPKTIRVVKDSLIRFEMRNGRLFHEGLQLGFPGIDPGLEISSWGSVGLDETLDLHLDVPRLDTANRKEKGPIHCHITGTISSPKLSVKDASLIVHLPNQAEAFIDVDGIDLVVRVEDSPTGQVLAFDPVVVFEKEDINRRMASSIIHLIDPNASYSPELTGQISMSLDKLRIPLELPEEEWINGLEIHGKLAIHEATTVAKGPVRQAIVKLLADLYGREEAKVVRVVNDAEIDFELRDGRMYHEGLRFGFPGVDPALVVSSRGSVGLDESLDLHLELPRLDSANSKDKGPVDCHITGTINNPRLSAKDVSLVVHLPNQAEAFIDVDGIDLVVRVEDSPIGQVLAFDPVVVFEREEINRRMASSIIHLIDPNASYSPELTGQISMSLDVLRIPLELPEEEWLNGLEIHGKLAIHEATTVAKGPVREAIVKLLADLYGKETAKIVRVVNNAAIDFELRDGRMYHEGMRLGFPDIDPALVITSRGSVGLDETLDLHLELPRLDREKFAEKGPVQCHVTGTISNPKLSAKDVSLAIHLADSDRSVLDIDGIDLTMEVETGNDGHILAFAPITVFEKQKFTPALSDELLRLVVPTLGDVADVKGEISLTLDRLRVPLGVTREELANRIVLDGRLKLHEVSMTVETPLLTAIVKVLADLNGKKPSEVIRVVKDADIHFEVRDGRLFHDGLRIGFPDISSELMVNSRGSVGLDGSLDLVVEVPKVLAKGVEVREDAKPGHVRFKITGTIETPTVVEIKE